MWFGLWRYLAGGSGRWAGRGERKRYPSDLSDEQWAVIGPFLQAWKDRHPSVSGHQGRYELREIVNAIFYQNRTGCQWAYLPHDLPPKSATYYYFALWRDDGTDKTTHELLRCQAREKAGRAEDPSAVVLDTQSVRAANHVPAATTGKDAAKRVPGRKRGTLADQLTAVETELADVATTRTTLLRQAGVAGDPPAADTTLASTAYQQILAVFTTTDSALRAKDICRALGTGTTANHTENLRAKLKRLVARGVLTEPESGLLTLAKPTTSSSNPEPTALRT